jgi:hypothetical protein
LCCVTMLINGYKKTWHHPCKKSLENHHDDSYDEPGIRG